MYSSYLGITNPTLSQSEISNLLTINQSIAYERVTEEVCIFILFFISNLVRVNERKTRVLNPFLCRTSELFSMEIFVFR